MKDISSTAWHSRRLAIDRLACAIHVLLSEVNGPTWLMIVMQRANGRGGTGVTAMDIDLVELVMGTLSLYKCGPAAAGDEVQIASRCGGSGGLRHAILACVLHNGSCQQHVWWRRMLTLRAVLRLSRDC